MLSRDFSPVCLVKDNEGACNHHFCMMANKHPKYFGISRNEFYSSMPAFTAFDVMVDHLIPHNPETGSGFESYRQSQNAIITMGGDWPVGLKVVPRDQVELRWAESRETYMEINEETEQNETLERLDVSEYAFYIGPQN